MKNWQQDLKQLKLQHIEKMAPGFFEMSGGYKMKVNPYRDDTANNLTRSICDFLTFKGHYANRINTQGQIRKERVNLAFGNVREITRFTKGTTNKGTADLHSIIFGLSVSIEIKIGRDKMSEDQRKEQQRVTAAGGLYYVARSMDEFLPWYYDLAARLKNPNNTLTINFNNN